MAALNCNRFMYNIQMFYQASTTIEMLVASGTLVLHSDSSGLEKYGITGAQERTCYKLWSFLAPLF